MAAAYPKWSRKELEVRERWLRTCDETAVRESWLNFHTEDIFGPLHELGGDHLFMYGAESPVVPADVLPEIQTANPRLELVAIPDAAHMLPWENTEYFLAQVSAYLRRLGG